MVIQIKLDVVVVVLVRANIAPYPFFVMFRRNISFVFFNHCWH